MEWLYITMYISVIFMFTFLITKIFRRLRQRHYEVPAHDIRKGHHWCMTDMFSQPTYCCISESHIIHGAFCDSCGVCVADQYIKTANQKFPCKALSSKDDIHKHHWVKGNLPLCSKCDYCKEDCGNLPQLCDVMCCWCQRTMHEKCAESFTCVCDLGTYRNLIIPPNTVKLKAVGMKGRRHLVVDSVRETRLADWSPLIVITSQKSGNNDGARILQEFRRMLNPAQVIDLSHLPPECALEWCHLLPHITCRVLAAGGDGTVGWILNAIEGLKLERPPPVCILPLGTGNDLSRVLGWGEGYTGDVDISSIVDQMQAAKVVKLDRWKVEIVPKKHFGIRMPKKVHIMNNYASIGVDALVTLNFHKHRQSRPHLFGSRILNKFWYFTYGTRDVLERECKNLEKKVSLELDGKKIVLPEVEGIVILNISSWGGGCQPWNSGGGEGVPECRYDDGMFEVMALYSSFHIAQLQVGLAQPLRLGQARNVKIQLFGGNAPMQVDGEPWEQHPADITITHHGQVSMFANSQYSASQLDASPTSSESQSDFM